MSHRPPPKREARPLRLNAENEGSSKPLCGCLVPRDEAKRSGAPGVEEVGLAEGVASGGMHRGAVWRLVLATAAWGLSFPTAKALMEAQGHFLPGYPAWFQAALVLFHRMAFAALLMGVFFADRLRRLQRGELWQGVQLGMWGALGMLLQTDAQNRIPASTSAFFTQFTSVFLPVWVAISSRRFPNPRVALASGLVVCGCALLSGVDFKGLGFGFGEWETILAALLFSGQILTLDQEKFRANDMRSVAVVMFTVKALVMLPVVLGARGLLIEAPSDLLTLAAATGWRAMYASPSMWLMLGLLTLLCTVYSYSVMTQWQPRVSPVHAGLIYATEPVFATLWALFLPGWFSHLAGLSYQNESLGLSFFAGATAILLANVLMALAPPPRA